MSDHNDPRNSGPGVRGTVGLALTTLLCLTQSAAGQVEDSESLLNVPRGFTVQLVAGDEMAHDIHSLTIDSLGRTVVSGPGYVRILVDIDEDGVADSYKQFSSVPATGAQGMFFLGRDLLYSGDSGLQILRDDNRDDRADGEPELFLGIQAGGEHHVHSIQRGPDGWWYVIAGNMSGVTGAYATLETSPLKDPYAGTLLRLKPDLAGGEVFADGFRNAYDFAFSSSGDLFTFDSDGERDISLPWYRPTRVFHVLPRSNAGWVSRSWKRPESFPDMPPVLAEFGRGSPSGVVCYRHTAYPKAYRGAIFALDWTYGRVLAMQLRTDGSAWSGESTTFATAKGKYGFAPTDMEVAPDGSLLISVGGRGTQGGVFRITYDAASETSVDAGGETVSSTDDVVAKILNAHQPLSSWSRAIWMPQAERLGKSGFQRAALSEDYTDAQRVRAIEILVELFQGPDAESLARLADADSPAVRARTAWAIGRIKPESPDAGLLKKLLADREPQVIRSALEALCTCTDESVFAALVPEIAGSLKVPDRTLHKSGALLIGRMGDGQQRAVIAALGSDVSAALWAAIGRTDRAARLELTAADFALRLLEAKSAKEQHFDAARMLELAMGDVGPSNRAAPVFDSYSPRLDLAESDNDLNPVRTRLAELFPTGDADVDRELMRAIAMLAPLNRELLDPILAKIDPQSLPADDVHALAVLSRIRVERTLEQTNRTAAALVDIDQKIKRMGLRQDSNWNDRIAELYRQLCDVDEALPNVIVDQAGFGLPAHVLFLSQVPEAAVPKAVGAFVRVLTDDADTSWSNDVVFAIGESDVPEHRELIRAQYDNLSVRDAVTMVLAENPEERDRSVFVEGLRSVQANVVKASIDALAELPAADAAEEQFALLTAARRLSDEIRDEVLREKVIRLLRRNTGVDNGFLLGVDGHKPQPEALAKWQTFLEDRYAEYVASSHASTDSAKAVMAMLSEVDWESGNLQRGTKLFETLSCAKCHGGRTALGPDLDGVAGRFSRDDLFRSIVEPNRDISSRYQTTSIQTISGKVYTGLIVYESIDGLLLRDASHKTYRIEAREIEERARQLVSLMPANLLNDRSAQDLADLYAYLVSLKK